MGTELDLAIQCDGVTLAAKHEGPDCVEKGRAVGSPQSGALGGGYRADFIRREKELGVAGSITGHDESRDDLSSQPRDTAACIIDFRGGKARSEPPQVGCGDETFDELIARVDAIGIDAPCGWPEAFREVVAESTSPTWDSTFRDRLRFR